jgi:hypothetical protein
LCSIGVSENPTVAGTLLVPFGVETVRLQLWGGAELATENDKFTWRGAE